MATSTPMFDYIVVGGGTAGLTVASRLSEDEAVRVLVIEAGTDHGSDPLVSTPGAVVQQYGNPKYDWNFRSVPQEALHGRSINQARGRGLGGSSSLNFMMWLHPSRASLDAWAALGNPGWAYDDLAPYLRKACTVHPPSAAATEMAALGSPYDFSRDGAGGRAGNVQVSFSEGYSESFNKAWMETFANLGHRLTADPRSGKAIGAFQSPASIDPKDHTRSSAAKAYLGPDVRQRSNLTVMTDTTVKRIIFERDAANADSVLAKGVVVVQAKDSREEDEEEETTITVKSEVILGAGALQSPQLLELSGIGGRGVLESHGIEVLVDNAGVGERLQDHALVPQSFEVSDGTPSGDVLRDPAVQDALAELYRTTNGGGPMGQSNIATAYMPLVDAKGVLMSAAEKKALLDAQLGTKTSEEEENAKEEYRVLRSFIEPQDEPTAQYLLFRGRSRMATIVVPSEPQNFATILTCLNHPASRGSVHIVSPDVRVQPRFDPRYMSHPLDLEILARHVQFVERIAATEPLRSSLKGTDDGGVRLPPGLRGDTLENAKEIVRRRQFSIYHVTGSCAMLPRERGGVVDRELRVYGTSNVRVVDASVFPLQTLGNTQSMVYAVAERAADIIKNAARNQSGCDANVSYRESAIRDKEKYAHWQYRSSLAAESFDKAGPSTFRQWWYDRRNMERWWDSCFW
ncbi:aryl-alcohol dehydrogenase [Apiospora phragmitis]|uniref:Aryl-alcohol dehydrogenase n=1 Tax=Apiospora phragmitis TaxID=2905665 RepID=A0ABR1VY64_9PEZI